ncbi:hypothetical protein TSAR_001568 [Trichomalopsis sarcophagae]|uniref:DUF659 domain-containing protein n=1 Tax=Trichomalopsis sarcophagae TaxID=543379 RepID=A0A232EUY0_9HYME|nr:hypothetical protein TSAR_001568 [Trichomalopsis sarcophagae]
MAEGKEEPTDGGLLMDGWKNSSANTKNVVSMIRLESFNFSSKQETAQNLIDVFQQSIVLTRYRFNVNLHGVVTDNASNIMSMGRMCELWHTTCNSHSGNLLCKAMVDVSFAKQVNTLLKEFKNPNLEHLLVEAGENRIILAGDTRWCSYRDVFRRALRNAPFMWLVVNNGAIIKDDNRNLLFDDNFELRLQESLVMLDPVCKLIRNCEKNTATITDSTEYWLQINLPAINNDFEVLIENRLVKIINKYG